MPSDCTRNSAPCVPWPGSGPALKTEDADFSRAGSWGLGLDAAARAGRGPGSGCPLPRPTPPASLEGSHCVWWSPPLPAGWAGPQEATAASRRSAGRCPCPASGSRLLSPSQFESDGGGCHLVAWYRLPVATALPQSLPGAALGRTGWLTAGCSEVRRSRGRQGLAGVGRRFLEAGLLRTGSGCDGEAVTSVGPGAGTFRGLDDAHAVVCLRM